MKGWFRASLGGVIKLHETRDPLQSSALAYFCCPQQRTLSYFSFVQKKKRANTTTQFWYTDISMIVLKRPRSNCNDNASWRRCHCFIQSVHRSCDIELFLDPEFEYCIIPFSYLSGKEELQCGSIGQNKKSASLRFTSYSAKKVDLVAKSRRNIQNEEIIIESIHFSLIGSKEKVIYSLGPSSVLVAVYKNGTIYFLALNAGVNGLMMQLNIQSIEGMTIVHGVSKDTHIIPSQSQRIISVLANNGHRHTSSLYFSFQADVCEEKSASKVKISSYKGVGTKIRLGIAGDLLCQNSKMQSKYCSGTGSLDKNLWWDTTNQMVESNNASHVN